MAKILVGGDDATNREVFTGLLNAEGHTMIKAMDGADGLISARTKRPELIVSGILRHGLGLHTC
jgi:CheY-like chemotaxis protein